MSTLNKIKKEDLPKNVPMSEHQLKRCSEVIHIGFFGKTYYIPLTKELEDLLKETKKRTDSEQALRDIINSVYMQIRDGLAADVKGDLLKKIGDGFERIFEAGVEKEVEKRFALLEDKRKE